MQQDGIEQDLISGLERTMGRPPRNCHLSLLARCWLGGEAVFQLDHSTELIGPLVNYLQDQLLALNFGDECTLMRVGVALTEAFENAVYHGNFELDSALRQGDGAAWNEKLLQRKNCAPYSDRKVRIIARLSPQKIDITVIDEGPGFDLATVPNPTQDCSLEKASGRGIHLMRALMDEVTYSERGNQVRLVKYSSSHPPGEMGATLNSSSGG